MSDLKYLERSMMSIEATFIKIYEGSDHEWKRIKAKMNP